MSNSAKRLFVLCLLLLLTLAACKKAPATPAPETPTAASSGGQPASTSTATSTATTTSPATLTPTASPVPTATPSPTPIIQADTPITAENIAELQVLHRLSQGSFNTAAWSPDGEWVLVGTSADLYVFDGHTLEQVTALGTGGTGDIIFSPDGQWMADGYANRMGADETSWINIWNWPERTLAHRIDTSFNIIAYAFTDEGETLLITGLTTTSSPMQGIIASTVHVQRVDAASGETTRQFTYRPPGILGIPEIIDEGQTIVVTDDTGVYGLDSQTGGLKYAYASPEIYNAYTWYNWMAYTSTSNPRQVTIVDLDASTPVHTFSLDQDPLYIGFEEKEDGQPQMYIITEQETIYMDLAAFEIVQTQPSPEAYTLPNPGDSRQLVLENDSLRLYDAPDGQILGSLQNFYPYEYAVAIHPEGTFIAVQQNRASGMYLDLWDLTTMQRIAQTHLATERGASQFAFTPDGQYILATDGKNTLYLLDAASGEILVRRNPLQAWTMYNYAISGDGRALVASTEEGLAYYDLPLLENEQLLFIFSIGDYGLALNHDASLGIASDFVNGGALFAVDDVREGSDFTAEPKDTIALGEITSPAFSPDGSLAAFFRESRYIVLMRQNEGGQWETLHTLPCQSADMMTTIGFMDQGRLLVAACDQTITFWDTDTGDMLRQLEGAGYTFSIAANDSLLVTLGGDVRIWGVP